MPNSKTKPQTGDRTSAIKLGGDLLRHLRQRPDERIRLERVGMGRFVASTSDIYRPLDVDARMVEALVTAGLLVEEHAAGAVTTYRLADAEAAGVPAAGDGQASAPPAIADVASGEAQHDRFDVEAAMRHGRRAAFLVEVTPELAAAWLEANTRNRPLRRASVVRYRRLMEKGRWMLGTDAVGFDTAGQIVNGQHRLEAVVDAGVAQTFAVLTGLDPEVFKVLDKGRLRSAADALAVEGFSNYVTLASAARLALLLWINAGEDHDGTDVQRDLVRGRADTWSWNGVRMSGIENDVIVDVATRCDPLLAECAAWSDNRKAKLSGLYSGPHVAFVRWAVLARSAEGAVREACDAALERAISGIGFASERDPAYQLRETMRRDKDSREDKLDTSQRLAYLVRAVNAAVAGEEVKTVVVKRNEPFPKPLGW